MSRRADMGDDGATGAEGRAGTTGSVDGPGAAGAPGPRGPSGGRNAAAGFLILMTFSFMGFVRVDQAGKERTKADREGCERQNEIRVNQAAVLRDEITQSELVLKTGLGPLENLREQIEANNEIRRARLRNLRESVSEHPVPGKPYRIDCADAYP